MRRMIREFNALDRDTKVRRLSIGGVVLSATVLSYSTLHHRAVTIGIPEWSAWFYPILYDAFILGASRTWQNQALSEPTRHLAKIATLGGIAAAIGAFVAEFWPKGIVAVAFSLIIPAVLATSLVLTSRAAADRKAAPEPKVTPEKPVTPRKVRAKVDAPAQPEKPAETATEPARDKSEPQREPVPTKRLPDEAFEGLSRREWINAKLDAGEEVTGAMINQKFGGRNGARDLRKIQDERASRNGHSVLAEEVKA